MITPSSPASVSAVSLCLYADACLFNVNRYAGVEKNELNVDMLSDGEGECLILAGYGL